MNNSCQSRGGNKICVVWGRHSTGPNKVKQWKGVEQDRPHMGYPLGDSYVFSTKLPASVKLIHPCQCFFLEVVGCMLISTIRI